LNLSKKHQENKRREEKKKPLFPRKQLQKEEWPQKVTHWGLTMVQRCSGERNRPPTNRLEKILFATPGSGKKRTVKTGTL